MRNERTETIVVLSKRNFYIALGFMISLDLLIVTLALLLLNLSKQEPVQLPSASEVTVSSSTYSTTSSKGVILL